MSEDLTSFFLTKHEMIVFFCPLFAFAMIFACSVALAMIFVWVCLYNWHFDLVSRGPEIRHMLQDHEVFGSNPVIDTNFLE